MRENRLLRFLNPSLCRCHAFSNAATVNLSRPRQSSRPPPGDSSLFPGPRQMLCHGLQLTRWTVRVTVGRPGTAGPGASLTRSGPGLDRAVRLGPESRSFRGSFHIVTTESRRDAAEPVTVTARVWHWPMMILGLRVHGRRGGSAAPSPSPRAARSHGVFCRAPAASLR